jgi:hypothetical protein
LLFSPLEHHQAGISNSKDFGRIPSAPLRGRAFRLYLLPLRVKRIPLQSLAHPLRAAFGMVAGSFRAYCPPARPQAQRSAYRIPVWFGVRHAASGVRHTAFGVRRPAPRCQTPGLRCQTPGVRHAAPEIPHAEPQSRREEFNLFLRVSAPLRAPSSASVSDTRPPVSDTCPPKYPTRSRGAAERN